MLVILFINTFLLLSSNLAMSLRLPAKLPSIFLFHGAGPGPLIDGRGGMFEKLDKNSPSTAFMKNIPRMIEQKAAGSTIKSVVVFSAHWEESKFQVDHQTGTPKLLYDYYGFPPETYAPHMTYPFKTDILLAERIHGLLNEAGVDNVLKPRNDGFDHGTFIPMKMAFPDGDVPIVQVSLNRNLDIESHIRLGEALAPLRREGVLLVGSGAITHNLRAINPDANDADPRATAFVAHMNDILIGLNEANYAERRQRLINVPKEAPYWRDMHPRAEHFIPIAVAFGTARPSETCETAEGETEAPMSVERVYHEIALGTLCADSYLFM